MIQIGPDMAEIQMVQARQAQQQAAAQGIASQWSAAQQGLAPSPLSTVTAANPMSGGLGGGMAAVAGGALPAMTRTKGAHVEAAEEDDGFNWSGAGKGAAIYGMQGAAVGSKFGGYGAAVGGAIGVVGGGIAGGLSDD
jgi:hypothetical protein